MTLSPSPSSGSSSSRPLTDREIGVLFLPLALTSTMMSVSVPVINAGLARLPHAEINLASFGIAFALSLVLISRGTGIRD